MLEWFRTQDFVNGKPSVSLEINSPDLNGMGFQQNTVFAIGIAIAIAAFLAGLLAANRYKRKEARNPEVPTFKDVPIVESEEEKILKVVRSSGGSINQSIIAERCRFSKAKTSQLLSALEQRGIVRRYKKGRDKVVILAQQH